jgi:hypothetical protein
MLIRTFSGSEKWRRGPATPAENEVRGTWAQCTSAKAAENLPVEQIHVRGGLGKADAGLETPDDVKSFAKIVGIRVEVWRHLLDHGERNPDIG